MFALRHLRFAGLAGLAVALAALSGPPATSQPGEQEKKTEEKKGAVKKTHSKLEITVPTRYADLQIEGKDTRQSGIVRKFETPEIDVAKRYEYSFSVTWAPNYYTKLTRTRSVQFRGGDAIVVDLSKADPKSPDTAVVRWVATPDEVVAEMIKLARITRDDVVYEPGPGDGKVLIAAVKAGAKKAVGIEIDPKLVGVAKEKVKTNRLEDRITIREGDALKGQDYSEATVVFLYMSNEFNNLLRPILEKQLKPGARIVSHRFGLGDWKPDKSVLVTGKNKDRYRLHIWTVKEKKGGGKK
jgi:uncharacterized protein (TIGR03000 family)